MVGVQLAEQDLVAGFGERDVELLGAAGDVVGTYAGYFIGTDAGGETETFPDGLNLSIVVVPTI